MNASISCYQRSHPWINFCENHKKIIFTVGDSRDLKGESHTLYHEHISIVRTTTLKDEYWFSYSTSQNSTREKNPNCNFGWTEGVEWMKLPWEIRWYCLLVYQVFRISRKENFQSSCTQLSKIVLILFLSHYLSKNTELLNLNKNYMNCWELKMSFEKGKPIQLFDHNIRSTHNELSANNPNISMKLTHLKQNWT